MSHTNQTSPILTIIGAGLAGCEAAWQAAEQGLQVTLLEMKPHTFSPPTTIRIWPNWSAPTVCVAQG